MRTQLCPASHASSEKSWTRTAKTGAAPTQPPLDSPQPGAASNPATARPPATAHTGTTARTRKARSGAVRPRATRRITADPATSESGPRIATASPAQTPSSTVSPEAIRSTIDQSNANNPSSAQKTRQSQTNRSQPPTPSPTPTTSPTAPRSALRLELEGDAVVMFIHQ